jgi:hypothetical protein
VSAFKQLSEWKFHGIASPKNGLQKTEVEADKAEPLCGGGNEAGNKRAPADWARKCFPELQP